MVKKRISQLLTLADKARKEGPRKVAEEALKKLADRTGLIRQPPRAAAAEPARAPAPAAIIPAVVEPAPETKRKRKKSPRRKGAEGAPSRPAEDSSAVQDPAPESRPRKRRRKEPVEAEVRDWEVHDFVVEPRDGVFRFHDFELPDALMHAIQDLGFEYCTPIQGASLPEALSGKDLFGKAQTGTGKTAAFLIALMTRFHANPLAGKRRKGAPRALIIAPTRELVMQLEKDAQSLGKYLPMRSIAVYGGMDFQKQEKALKAGPVDILAATPGRLLDFVRRRVIQLQDVEALVIDEADRMLDMGFIPDVSYIIRSCSPKAQRQTMLFSATLTDEVRRLAGQWTKDPVHIEIDADQVAADSVEQVIYIVTDDEKFIALYNLVEKRGLERVLVFCNRKDETFRISERLKAQGIEAEHMSGDVRQEKRVKVLESFREGRIRVLVATDVAARGIHVDNITHVVNYDLPENPEDFVHRIGRTGRAGETGTSVSFASESDSFFILPIQDFIGQKLASVFPPDEFLEALPKPDRIPDTRRRTGSGRSSGQRSGGRSGGRDSSRGRSGGSRRRR